MPTRVMLRHPLRRHPRRGAAMLAVTLLAVAASVLALLIVRQVIVSARASVFEQLTVQARDLADDTLGDTVARLSADPALAFRQVLDDEATRRCVIAAGDATLAATYPDHPLYAAGSDWPEQCGTWWTHEPAAVDPVALKVLPPSPAGDLAVQVLAQAGKVQAGRSVVLRTPGSTTHTVWTDGNLSIDELADGDLTLSGSLYASRRLFMPTEALTWGPVQLAAEDGFVGDPTDADGQRYYAAAPDLDATPPIRDVRDIAPTASTTTSLVAALTTSQQVACPVPTDPVVVTIATVDYASHLCLEPGRTVIDSSGAPLVVPPAGAWLVLPDATSPGTVDVHYRAEPVATDVCRLACDLYGLAAVDVAAGTHPGTLDGWTPLGTLHRPASGLLGVPGAQTHVGLCGDAFVGASASCQTTAASSPLTVVAGTARAPADVIVGGDVSGVGLAATGDVLLAYWAAPAGGDVSVQAHLVTPGSFAGLPRTRPTAPVDATGGTLTLAGSLIVSDLLPVEGFAAVDFVPAGLASTPWLPGPDAGLLPTPALDLSTLQACGQPSCDPW